METRITFDKDKSVYIVYRNNELVGEFTTLKELSEYFEEE